MNIRPYYVYQKAVFPAAFCDRIVEEGERLQAAETAVIGAPQHARPDAVRRSTDVAFFPQRQEFAWLYQTILDCINAANAKYWNFNLSAVEPAQFGTYNPGQFYGWHIDQHPSPYESGSFKGLTRKLSFTLQLDEEDAYEGGDFELREPGEDDVVQRVEGTRARGSVIIFPSFVFHRVTPVTRGVRRSLVGWIVGPPFV